MVVKATEIPGHPLKPFEIPMISQKESPCVEQDGAPVRERFSCRKEVAKNSTVYGRYHELVSGVYKPTCNWGAQSGRDFIELNGLQPRLWVDFHAVFLLIFPMGNDRGMVKGIYVYTYIYISICPGFTLAFVCFQT